MFFSFTEIYKLFSRKNMAAAASDAAPSIHQGEALVVTADDSEVIRTLSLILGLTTVFYRFLLL